MSKVPLSNDVATTCTVPLRQCAASVAAPSSVERGGSVECLLLTLILRTSTDDCALYARTPRLQRINCLTLNCCCGTEDCCGAPDCVRVYLWVFQRFHPISSNAQRKESPGIQVQRKMASSLSLLRRRPAHASATLYLARKVSFR